MKKLICVMLTVLMITALFAGCGTTADDGVYKIAIVQQLDHASLNEIRAAVEPEYNLLLRQTEPVIEHVIDGISVDFQ